MRISNDVQSVLVFREPGARFLYLLIKRHDPEKKQKHYRLLKGGVKNNEDKQQALIREIREEVGLHRVEVLSKLKNYQYVAGDITHKVTVYLVSSDEKSVKIDSEEEGGFLILDHAWVGAEDAVKLLNFTQEKDCIRDAQKVLEPNT